MTRRTALAGLTLGVLSRADATDYTDIIQTQVNSGMVSAAVLLVRHGKTVTQRAFGKAPNSDAVFLLASITKPMTTAAVMTLADRKEVSLSDKVQRFVPEFRGGNRDEVQVRHLLTHTSGLPDMLPNDVALRERHAPLSEFVKGACGTPLLFRPGARVQYQSMGILLAAEIVSRVSGRGLPEFTKEHVFGACGMKATSIGLGGRPIGKTMRSDLETATDWDWNSPYWRNLASPWGGGFSTVSDVDRFLRVFVDPAQQVLKPESAKAMITNQTRSLNKPWGLGWMLNDGQFGKGCSAATFGHSGSTGTLCWLDPKRDLSFVLLTTKPAKQSAKMLLDPVSDAVSIRT